MGPDDVALRARSGDSAAHYSPSAPEVTTTKAARPPLRPVADGAIRIGCSSPAHPTRHTSDFAEEAVGAVYCSGGIRRRSCSGSVRSSRTLDAFTRSGRVPLPRTRGALLECARRIIHPGQSDAGIPCQDSSSESIIQGVTGLRFSRGQHPGWSCSGGARWTAFLAHKLDIETRARSSGAGVRTSARVESRTLSSL